MFLKTKKPQAELEVLLTKLEVLDDQNNGPDWMYLPREKSKYNIQRIKLINQIIDLEPNWIPPEKPK